MTGGLKYAVISNVNSQFVVKVSSFRLNTHTKTHVPLPDWHVDNALIQFVPNCQDTWTQFVDVLDPLATLHAALSHA